MTRRSSQEWQIRQIADDVGVDVKVHARVVGRPPTNRELCIAADEATPIASLYKLPLAAAWSDLVRAGRTDPTGRLTLAATDRAAGPTGISGLADDVDMSQRDAVRMMLALSDNAAADAVREIVGRQGLSNWLTGHGFDRTEIRAGSAESMRRVIADLGGRTLTEALAMLADPRFDRRTSQYDAALASSSTARDLTGVLDVLWTRPHHGWVRDSMRQQAWRHRVGSGFPHDDVDVAGKTGSLGKLRHEAAVVQFPGEFPVAVTILTTAVRPELHQPRVDEAIGVVARIAVNSLRCFADG